MGWRVSVVAVLLGLLGLFAGAPAAAQDDTGWVIDSFDAAITVHQDGSLAVTETIAVDFGTLERRGIFRAIPVRYRIADEGNQVGVPEGRDAADFRRVVAIDGVEVASTAPSRVQLTEEGGHLRIRIGDPDVTVSGPQRYEIRYRARGALNSFETHEELYWNVTGHEWPVTINRASVRVDTPETQEASCFQGPVGATRLCPSAGGGTAFTAGPLRPGEGMTVVAAMTRGAVDVPPPVLEEEWTLRQALMGSPLTVPLTVLTSALGFGAVGLLAYRQGRDRVARGDASIDGHVDVSEVSRRGPFTRPAGPVRFRPPDSLRPAQLGLIVDERVDPVEISATIVDLAVRGHLLIEERTSGRLWWSKTDWLLKRLDGDDSLLDYEQYLLGELFKGRSEVLVSKLRGTFADSYKATAKRIYTDGAKRGWFPRNPEHTRAMWFAIGVGVTALATGLLYGALQVTTFALAAVPFVVAGVVLTVAHNRMPHRTPEGSRLLVETLGFKQFIETADADRLEFAEQENIFERYLPYAMIFGCVDKWSRAFAHLAAAGATGVAAGGWYAAAGGGRADFSRLSGGLSDFSNSVGSSLAYAPSSGGSGGGSGGGSSGGGFGGGGGGSW